MAGRFSLGAERLFEVALRDPLERKYALDLTGNANNADDISRKLLRDLDGVSIEQAMSGDESDTNVSVWLNATALAAEPVPVEAA